MRRKTRGSKTLGSASSSSAFDHFFAFVNAVAPYYTDVDDGNRNGDWNNDCDSEYARNVDVDSVVVIVKDGFDKVVLAAVNVFIFVAPSALRSVQATATSTQEAYEEHPFEKISQVATCHPSSTHSVRCIPIPSYGFIAAERITETR